MGRPAAKELTERELEVMHVFWRLAGEAGVAEVRGALTEAGLELAYTTVATLIKILVNKGFLVQTNDERPYRFRSTQSYEDVSTRMLSDVVERVFKGSREQLLVRLLSRKRLTTRERSVLERVLRGSGKGDLE